MASRFPHKRSASYTDGNNKGDNEGDNNSDDCDAGVDPDTESNVGA